MKFLPEQIKIANKTCRSNGAVGKNAIVPKLVPQFCKKSDKILDFGCGTNMVHVKNLREFGYKVHGYEFGDNVTDEHIGEIKKGYYDIVYMSNVLNVQLDEYMLTITLSDAVSALKNNGKLIANYPSSPRKSLVDIERLEEFLEVYFDSVEKLSKNVFVCSGLRA